MRTLTFATITGLGIASAAAVSAPAGAATTALAWQQPGYVTDIVTVTAPGPKAGTEPATASENWSDPGALRSRPITNVRIPTDSENDVRAKAAEIVRDALAATQIAFDGLLQSSGNDGPVL
jgi:hypothetical protein